MKFETAQGISLPKIGFGTWKMGGGLKADPSKDTHSINALRCAIEVGYTHFDTAEIYAAGRAEELLGKAIKDSNIARESLILTSKVEPENLKFETLIRSCEASLRRLRVDYLDIYLIHWPPNNMDYEETFAALRKLVEDQKVRHVGVSNFKLDHLTKAQAASNIQILTNQVPYNLSNRSYIENGSIRHCLENDILITAYSPFAQGELSVPKTLLEISEDHNSTPHQIALAWLVAQKGVITIPMSFQPNHIEENFASVDIELSKNEINRLNTLA